MSEALDPSGSMGTEAVPVTRTAALREIPRMNLEEAHGTRRSRRLTQEQTAPLPGVSERAFAGARKVKLPVAHALGHEDFNAVRRSPRPHPASVPRPKRPFRTLEHAG